MRRIRSHLTFANATSLVAVFIALGGTAYAVGTIGSAEVINESLRGVDIKNRSLLGEDLGVRVRGARQVEDTNNPAAICGEDPDFDQCTTVNFTVPRPQRLLLVGSGEWAGNSSAGNNKGECSFLITNDFTGADLGLRKFGEAITGPSNPSNFAMNSVTPVIPEGFYDVSITCRDTSTGTGGMTVRNTELSVVAIGDG